MKAKVIKDLTFIGTELMDALDRDDMQSVAHLALDVIPRMVEEYQSTPQKPSVTIDGWVARNKGGEIWLHKDKPNFIKSEGRYGNIVGYYMILPTDSFPDLKWEDEPLAVTIQITEK